MYITLKEAKKHLNIDDYFAEDDNYIISLIKVAEEAVSKRIDRDFEKILVDGELPETVRHAVLLLIGNWYQNREPISFTSATPMPYTFDFLVDLNKHYHFF